MFYKQIKEQAELMGVPVDKAVEMRIKYLHGEIAALESQLLADESSLAGCVDPVMVALLTDSISKLHQRLGKLRQQVELLRRQAKGESDFTPVSDAEHDAANEVPMTELIEFVRGKATAPCHEDRSPSMFYGARRNIAVCPVCDKRWTPVSWCMDQMGLSYRDAVYYLLGRGR